MTTPGDIKYVISQVREAIKASTDQTVTLTMQADHARLFVDFLCDFDPDMPPRAICKILGPLVGDHMMNAKLQRLDEIADKLGPAVLLLNGLITQRASK